MARPEPCPLFCKARATARAARWNSRWGKILYECSAGHWSVLSVGDDGKTWYYWYGEDKSPWVDPGWFSTLDRLWLSRKLTRELVLRSL